MKIIVCDPNPLLINELVEADSYLGTFQELDGTLNRPAALANAGNGWGLMGAGIAGAIARRFPEIKRIAQSELARVGSRMPARVGESFLIPTGDPSTDYKYIAYTVTMENPGTTLNERDKIPYKAMRATLKAVEKFNDGNDQPIETLVVPGFGGGIGGLSPKHIAYGIESAIEDHG